MKLKMIGVIILLSSLSQAKVLTCIETKESSKNNSYGRILTLEVSLNKKQIKISAAATADMKAVGEIVKRDDTDTSKNEEGNLDEDYNRKSEARYTGSDDLSSTDTGTCLFVSKNILSGKSGQLRISGGQGNESDSGPMILWFESAVLDCK